MNDASGPCQSPSKNPYTTKTIDEYELKGIIGKKNKNPKSSTTVALTCIGVLGYGSSAVVYGAFDTLRNAHVAIKMIDLDFFERNQIDELRVSKEIMWYE
jgi:hypothetical protein